MLGADDPLPHRPRRIGEGHLVVRLRTTDEVDRWLAGPLSSAATR